MNKFFEHETTGNSTIFVNVSHIKKVEAIKADTNPFRALSDRSLNNQKEPIKFIYKIRFSYYDGQSDEKVFDTPIDAAYWAQENFGIKVNFEQFK